MTTPPGGERRGRGRPREVVRRAPGEGSPLTQRPSELPATTRAILDAAHRVLVRSGTKGLTLVAVAREAHVDVTTVSYHFGTRHGLIEALMDRLYREPTADFADSALHLPDPEQRWHAYLQSVRRMYQDRDATLAYFEIAALALRDPALRLRLARLNDWTVDAFTEAISRDAGPSAAALAQFIYAAIDGIELHHALSGDAYPLDEVLQILERMVVLAAEQAAEDDQRPDR